MSENCCANESIEHGNSGELIAYLNYKKPYCFDDLLSFFASRTLIGVEKVEDGAYLRTALISKDGQDFSGWLCVTNDEENSRLKLEISESLRDVASVVVERVSRQFDVNCDPVAVAEGIATLDDLVPGAVVCGTRLPGCFEPFETACRAVLGQQVTVSVANKLAARIVEAYGTPTKTNIEGLAYAFPKPEQILKFNPIEDAFGQLGVIKTRSRTIYSIASLLESGGLDFSAQANVEEQFDNLLAIKGIGPWSANYIAMRCLSYSDAFLESDSGIKHALPEYEPKQRLEFAQNWRPYRSYANICLWNSLAPKGE